METTNREWFESWEEYGQLAIEEAQEQAGGVLDETSESLKGALVSAFIWSNTSQGHLFWQGIYESLSS
jgi:hypothetical protein